MVVHLYRGQVNIETKQHEVLRSNFFISEAKPMKVFVDFFFLHVKLYSNTIMYKQPIILVFVGVFFLDNIRKGH